MEEFNWEDNIPEGLEFKEEYMTQAFEMYDAAKNKRKKRFFIWFFTSALAGTLITIGVFGYLRPSTEKTFISKNEQSNQQVAEEQTSRSESKIENSEVKSNQKEQVKEEAILKGNTFNSLKRTKRKTNKTKIEKNQSNSDYSSNSQRESIQNLALFGENQLDNPLGKSLVIKNLVARFDSVNKLNVEPKMEIYAVLVTNTLFGIEAQRGKLKLQEALGFEVNLPLKNNWRMALQAEYYGISQVDYRQYIGANETQDPSRTYFTKTALSYLSATPKLSYRFRRHEFSVGLGGEFLLPFSSTKYGTKEFTSADVEAQGKDLYSAFKRFNGHAQIGYSFSVKPYLLLHTSYTYGFTDVTINSPINTAFDRNSRLQLGVKLKLNAGLL